VSEPWFKTPLGRATLEAAKAALPPKRATRQYAGARVSRLTTGWGTASTSEDAELSSSLRALRDRCRALVRDAGYAKRAKVVVVNNVVHVGIGLQANVRSTRGERFDRVNESIEKAWADWCRADSCHTGGSLHFADLERALMGQVFETGEIFVRLHFAPFGRSAVPLALELIEPERIADDFQQPPPGSVGEYRLGIEQDVFGRPLAYWIRDRHPNEAHVRPGRSDRLVRVPAAEIIHLRIIERWPQSRAVPWMHAVARKLNDVDGYTEAEIVAARGAANYMGVIESDADDFGEQQDDGTTQMELQPGIVERLRPGEKFDLVAPNRPNAAADQFIRLMLREIASGIGLSYESLSRDYSQSNYSSSRLALLDDRDLWRVLQGWFIRTFRQRLHETWLQQAVLARAISAISVEEYAINPAKFEAVQFKPRGWGWVDPTKEVEAYKEAVKAGFTTVGDVVAATAGGLDLEDVANARRDELELFEELDLTFDTSPEVYVKAQAKPAEPAAEPAAAKPAEDDPEDEPAQARVVTLRR
jgi:lambda family phage portal protein